MGSAPLELLAAVTGRVVPIEAVEDPAFSEKMVGDGLAIDPDGSLVTAPCGGRVVQVHKARHAYGILAPSGARVLVHVGLETVALKGAGFKARVAEGDEVRAGQPLVEVDRALLAKRGVNPLTVVVVENPEEHPVTWRASAATVVRGGADRVLRLGGDAGDGGGGGGGAEPGGAGGEPPAGAGAEGAPASGRAVVGHAGGLHARPAALVAAAARRFRAAVEVLGRGRSANARSCLALMALATDAGEVVEVMATGPEAGPARDAVVAAIEGGGQAPRPAPPPPGTAAPSGVGLGPNELAGVIASRGVAVGQIFHLRVEVAEVAEEGRGEAHERGELERALREVAADLEAAVAAAGRGRAAEEVAILEANRAMLEDPELFGQALALIAAGKGAAHAWAATVRTQAAVLAGSGNQLLAERVADLRDLERQVVARLTGRPGAVPALPARAILLAEELSPGELAALDRSRLAGIVTHRGGPTSHVSIVARSQGIPALVATGPALRLVPEGAPAVLDAERGVLTFQPSAARLAAAEAEMVRAGARRREAERSCAAPAVTRDGLLVEVAANVSSAAEAAAGVAHGADGVGLLRTELLFLGRETAPSEEEQRAAYQQVVDALGGRTVVIRTLDVGADKALAYLPMPREENPALGLRGLRLGLARKELLAEQLRACLRVRPLEQVRIMLPMVTELEDLLQAREVLRLAAEQVGVAPPALGVMIETPAAALLAEAIAAEAAFLSIGTNDLTQYALAMDRGNAAVAQRVDDLHPAVLRLVASTAAGGAKHGRWVGVCGGMAADPLAVPLLLGLGVTELSVGPAAVAEVKALVRRLDRGACAALAREVLELASAGAVRARVRAALPELAPARS